MALKLSYVCVIENPIVRTHLNHLEWIGTTISITVRTRMISRGLVQDCNISFAYAFEYCRLALNHRYAERNLGHICLQSNLDLDIIFSYSYAKLWIINLLTTTPKLDQGKMSYIHTHNMHINSSVNHTKHKLFAGVANSRSLARYTA